MISMNWRADSENSENSALDTIIVSHKIYEKKLFFHRFHLISSDSPIKQPTGILLEAYCTAVHDHPVPLQPSQSLCHFSTRRKHTPVSTNPVPLYNTL